MSANTMARSVAAGVLLMWGVGAANAQAVSNPYSYARSSGFSYYTAADGALNGLLKSETVEPGAADAQLCVVTSYTYDARGNKKGATTANCSGATGRALFDSRSSAGDFGTSSRAQTLTLGSGTASPSTRSVTQAAGLFQISVTNALNQQEKREYDSRFGAVIRLEGPNGATLATRWEVDDFGRKVKEIRADGTMTLMWHCVVGVGLDTSSNTIHLVAGQSVGCPSAAGAEQPSAAASMAQSVAYTSAGVQAGPLARSYSDRLGREIRTATEAFDGAQQAPGRSAAWVVTDVEYNAQGAKVVQSHPYFLASSSSTITGTGDRGLTRTDYDTLGRPVAVYVVDPNGSQPSIAFGSFGSFRAAVQRIEYAGLTTTQTNDKGQVRKEEKSIEGQVIRVTDASLAQLAHQYDAFGNLVKTKDALQNSTEIQVDKRGRKLSLKDPDAGLTKYDYNALGELVWQQTAVQAGAATSTTMVYDKLGRMTQRVEPEFTSNWSYDKYFADAAGTSTCSRGIGKLCESSTTQGTGRKFAYDSLGRPSTSTTTLGSTMAGTVTTMVGTLSYDANTGRVSSQTYPTGVKVGYAYTTRGYLEKLLLQTTAVITPLPATPNGTPGNGTTLNAGSTLWQAMEVNAWGRVEKQWHANGINGRSGYEAATGRVTSLTGGPASSNSVRDMALTWDSLGQLVSRIDRIGDNTTGAVSETFDYQDSLNRLTRYQVSAANIAGASRTVELQYNALGLLLYKSDVGNYAYPAQGAASVRPHALQSVTMAAGSTSFQYDDNGNLRLASGGKYRSVSYTSFNLPDSNQGLQGPGSPGLPKYRWFYDENHARVVESQLTAAGTRTTLFLHPDNQGGLGFERETAASGAISNRHYLSAGGQVVGVLVTTGALQATALNSVTAVKLEFWHKDHLGSVVATSDHAGTVTARYAYDPFGKRRFADGRYDDFGTLVVDWRSDVNSGTDRGFTGHEHLDDVGLVHMNGRIFDPALGVFLQADPVVQDLLNLQNFNRYGYCFNSPLNCTDPSGNFSLKKALRLAAVIAVAWYAPILAQNFLISSATSGFLAGGGLSTAFVTIGGEAAVISTLGSVASAAVGGFAAGAVASGTLSGAVQGAFSAGMFYGAGELIQAAGSTGVLANEVAQVALHGVTGCVVSASGGGKCGPGALSAAFSKAALPLTAGLKDGLERAVVHAIIGGTASELGGGKFANGAQSGAFSYLFNHWAHRSELATYGKEAHDLLQDYAEERGYVTESKCATPTNCVDGRFDIASARAKEVWEIKRNSFFGLAMGELALDAYTAPETGLRRGGNLIGLKVGGELSLWKGDIEYRYTNYGDGLIGYSRFDHTPQQPIRIYVPKLGPVPGGSRGRGDQFGY